MLVGFAARYEDDVPFAVSFDLAAIVDSKTSIEYDSCMTISAPVFLDKPVGELYETQALITVKENLISHTAAGVHPFDSIKEDSVEDHVIYSAHDSCLTIC